MPGTIFHLASLTRGQSELWFTKIYSPPYFFFSSKPAYPWVLPEASSCATLFEVVFQLGD